MKDRENVTAHYCITRADLSHGVQAAQLIHAAGESSPGNVHSGTFAYAKTAKDEKELRDLSYELFMAGIPHKCILEPDAPWNGQMMAIGVCPGPKTKLKKYFARFPLLK